MYHQLLTVAGEAAPVAEEVPMALTPDNSTIYAIALLLAAGSIVLGIVLLRGKPEFLGRSRFLIGRNGKMDDQAMAVAHLTGVQMVAIGVLLGAAALLLINGLVLAGAVSALLIVILPIPFSIYRKRSPRFQHKKPGQSGLPGGR